MSSARATTANKSKHPYPIPNHISPELAQVHAYWRGLLRGSADMPFWDDARLSDLPDLQDELFLVDVFDKPERFRFASLGKSLPGEDLAGRFLDETALGGPLAFLRSQAAATVECAQPTFHHDNSGPRPYARLLLPMWGEGRISMLLGAVDFA